METKKSSDDLLESVSKDRLVRQTVAKERHLMFFIFYFHAYIKHQIAEFQKEIFRITEDQSNTLACIVAFRGSGKSTLVTLSYSLWAILGIQQKKFVLMVCQTQAQARQHMANIKHELEHNTVLRSDLGPFREDTGSGEWAMSSLVFQNTNARIMIASVDQSVRGIRHRQYRPDLIILDDIEDVNSVKTYEGRTRIVDWFSREIVPLGDIGTRIILVGNLLHEDSLMMQLRRKMERGELKGIYKWFPLLDGNGDCLWKEKFDTPDKIETLKQSVISENAWSMEYLLLLVSDTSRIIHPEWIKFYTNLPKRNRENKYRGAYVGIDLAISEKERADCTAMVAINVFGFGDEMKIYVEPHPVNTRIDFSTSIQTAKLLSKTHAYEGRNSIVYVENNGYMDAFAQTLRNEPGVVVEGIPSRGDKRSRLSFVSTLVKSGRLFFPEKGTEELIMQLVGFGMERHDDLVDAFSLVVGQVLINNRAEIIFPKQPTEKTITSGLLDEIF